ncbi:MAG: asparaginase [Nocardioidaceae bacterium]
MSQPVVAEIVRSGVVEGHHYGAVVATRPDGSVDWSVGDVEPMILPRSSNKPLQGVALVRLGLDLPPELTALACASHSGEPFHVAAVRRLLAHAGLDESALQCPPDLPVDDEDRAAVWRAGGGPERIFMNCSGKHAAMVATCVLNRWDPSTYLEPQHPLQRAIVATFCELTGEPTVVAVDGCGAPLLGTSLVGLARAFGRVARGVDGSGADHEPASRVAEAIRSHPTMVSGTRRDEAALHAAVPGLLAKGGAEAVYAAALPDGRAIALKIDDGAERARQVVMAAALLRWGVGTEPGVDAEALRRTGDVPLLGGGRPVGEVRALL